LEGIVNIGDKQIWYRLSGLEAAWPETPLLVFLHEGLGCSAQWRGFPEQIAAACALPLLMYDRWGYGLSSAKHEPNGEKYMHFEAYEMLPALLEHLGISRNLMLFGHSDGGTIALLFAGAFPQKTLGVISECDHVICEEITGEGVKRVVQAFAEGKLKKLLMPYHGEKTEALVHGWTHLWLSEKGKHWSMLPELKQVVAPVLNIQGRNDHFGSVQQLALKLEHCSGPVQISLLNDCGHIPHHEQRETVTELTVAFINHLLNQKNTDI